MAPPVALNDWFATIAYKDANRRHLCLKVFSEEMEVQIVLRRGWDRFEGAWEKGLGDFKLIGPASIDKAELAGVPQEYMSIFEKGIPSNWTSILQEANSRPLSFLSTLPPLPSPIASTSRLPEPQHIPRKRPDKNLPLSLFDLGTGYQPKGGKMRTVRELANGIRNKKGKGRAMEEIGREDSGVLVERDTDYDEEVEIAKEEEEEEKRKLETAKIAQQSIEAQGPPIDKDFEMVEGEGEQAAEPDPPPPPIPPSFPSSPEKTSLPPLLDPLRLSNPPRSIQDSRPLSKSTQSPDPSTRIAIELLVEGFFTRGLPIMTATEGPYVTYVPNLDDDTRTLLESLAYPVTLSPAQVGTKNVKKMAKRYRLVDKLPNTCSEAATSPGIETIEGRRETGARVENSRDSPGELGSAVDEEDVTMGDVQMNGEVKGRVVGEAESRVETDGEEESGYRLEGVMKEVEEEPPMGKERVETTLDRDGSIGVSDQRMIDEDELGETGRTIMREQVDEDMLEEVEADVGMEEVTLMDNGSLGGEGIENELIANEDEEDLEEEEEIIEERKVLLTLSPRITGERDEIVPVKLDSSSPIPASPIHASNGDYFPSSALPSPPDSPLRHSSNEPIPPPTPSFSDFYDDDEDSDNSLDVAAKEVDEFVQRVAMGLSSDAAGPNDSWTPSKPRPPKTIEKQAVENVGEGVKELGEVSTNGGNAQEPATSVAAVTNGSLVSRPRSPSPAINVDNLSDLNPFKLPSPIPQQRSASPRRPSPSSHSPAKDPLESSPPPSKAVLASGQPAKVSSPSPDSPAPLLDLQSILHSPRLRTPSPTPSQSCGQISPIEPLERASPSPVPSTTDEPRLETPSLADSAQAVEALSAQPVSDGRIDDTESTAEHLKEVSREPVNSIDVVSQPDSTKGEASPEQLNHATGDPGEGIRAEEQISFEVEESKELESSVSPVPEFEDEVVEVIVEEIFSDTEAGEQGSEVDEESEGGNEIDEAREVDQNRSGSEEETRSTNEESTARADSVNDGALRERVEQLEMGEEPSTEEEEDTEKEQRVRDDEEVKGIEEVYDTREILVGRKRSASLESLPLEAVSPPSNQQHYKSPRSASPEVSPVHETEQRVELHSQGSDASASSQATDAAMKALRNDSTSPDPATFDFGEPQPEYGGGFDEEEEAPNEQIEDVGTTNGLEQEECSTISRSPSPVDDSASLRQDSLPLPIPSKTKANSTTRSTGKELSQPRLAFIGVEVPSHRERSTKKQVVTSKDSSRSQKSTPPESLSDRHKSPSPPIASTSAAVHPLSPVPSIEDQDQDRELSGSLRSRPSPVVYRSRHRSGSASTQPQTQPQGLDSSSSEVRSPPPKRRPAKGGQKIKKNPKQDGTVQSEASKRSPSPIEAKEESVEVEIEKVEKKPISKRAKGKGKAVEQLVPFDEDEDEIGYSPRAVLAYPRKRRPSLSQELASTSQKPQKSRKLRQSTPPASSSPRKHHLKNGINDSGHSQSESFASRQSRTAQLANSRKANQKTPVLSSPHRQNSQARSSSRGTGSSSRPQRTIKNASEWWQVGGGSGIKREREESDFEGDGDVQEENVVEEEVVSKKRGKPQKKKAKKVVAEEEESDRSQQVPGTKKRKSVELDDEEEEEEAENQQSQSPSQVDEAYPPNPASDRDETPPVASTSRRPAAAAVKNTAPAPAPKKRKKRKSIVMPRPKAKKKEPVSPQASPKQKKKVVPAEEKLSRASGVKAQRKRVAAAERGRGKKKNFEESESEESEEWDGE
ncbi:hypothetical protein JCM5353_005374 [Sporobolomyces roseus]